MSKRGEFFKKLQTIKVETDWERYQKQYGSLLKNVFEEDINAKKILCDVFRMIDDPKADAENFPEEICVQTEKESAVISFAQGLLFEKTKQPQKALDCFIQALSYETNSEYLYLKTAQIAHKEGLFAFAAEHYRAVIQILEHTEEETKILALSYTNLCYCLTMMRHFREAEDALIASEIICAFLPERESAAAILYAAQGDEIKSQHALNALQRKETQRYHQQASKIIDQIIRKEHPQLSEIPVDANAITIFWEWFAATDAPISEKEIALQLKKVFPFYKREIAVSVLENEKISVFVGDAYAKSLESGLKCLFSQCPAPISEKFRFIQIR